MEAASLIPKAIEDEKEHSSSTESGWTMYIGSSIYENDHYNYIGDEHNNYTTHKQEEGYDGNNHNDDESDDSMASDASSGPSHDQKFPCSSERKLGRFVSTSTEKLHKQQVMKRDQRRNKFDKEMIEVKTNISAASHVGSQDKVKIITNCMSQEEE